MKGLFIPEITAEMFRNGCLEGIEALMAEGEIYDIEYEPQWIPCSERLPEKDGRYLVTCSKIGSWEVDWNIWYNEPKPSWLWEQGVTAWMPLPEPYKGGKHEQIH